MSKRVPLKIGDTVRTVATRKTRYVVAISEDFYTLDDGINYCRSALYKIPTQSPASKLAAVNNFWQGRARSIQAQITSLIRDLPVDNQYIGWDLREINAILSRAMENANRNVYEKLARLKQEKLNNETNKDSGSHT